METFLVKEFNYAAHFEGKGFFIYDNTCFKENIYFSPYLTLISITKV